MKKGIISYQGISSALILLFFLSVGCSTRRNTAVARAFHELTTRYNLYYNAEQAYHEILEEQSRNFTDRYDSLLPLYPRIIPEEMQLPGGAFDGVVEKTSKAIREHSITAKPRRNPVKRLSAEQREWLQQEEFNPFLHKAWMLLGKAHLQNGDLEEALAVFSHISRIYRHDREITHEAAIWMLRCYTEQNRLYQAEQSAQVLLAVNLPGRLQQLFRETYTGYLLKRGDYSAAIPWLKRVIRHEKVRSQKIRLQYLLGQLLQVTGKQEEAFQAFEAVIGLSTPFNLKLQATASQLSLAPQEKQHKIKRALERMKSRANEEQMMRIELVLAGTTPTSLADATAMAEKRLTSPVVNDSLLPISQQHDSLYQKLYSAFMKGDSTVVGTVASLFTERFPESAWLPQVHEMRSLVLGGKLPPESPPGTAWERLSRKRIASENDIPGKPLFLSDLTGTHLFLLAFERQLIDRNRLLFSTAAFNFAHFRLRTFEHSFLPLDGMEALAITPFHSYRDAFQYGEMLLSDSLFTTTIPAGVIPVVISEENADRVRRKSNLSDYLSFLQRELTEDPLSYKPLTPVVKHEKTGEEGEQVKKIVPLESDSPIPYQPEGETTVPPSTYQTKRLTPDELLKKLEQNVREAMKLSQNQTDSKEQEEQLKERERIREERIRQREKELKEHARRRKQRIREREKEREQKIRNR